MAALAFECALRSDVGRRANNEDAVYASPRLAAVADGVGGAAAGEIASRAVINALVDLDKRRLPEGACDALTEAVRWGNETIALIAECRPHTAGMSTTLTAVALANDATYALTSIGDSRTYLLRDGQLTLLTHDDTFVQYLVDEGRLTVEEARRHPQRSLVLQALDGSPERTPPVRSVAARAGDRLLLCSDGLSDMVDDATIAAVLGGGSRERAADALVEAALDAGGRDNVSAVVADVVTRRDLATTWPA